MNVRTKNGTRTIKLDAAERRTLQASKDIIDELSRYNDAIVKPHRDINATVYAKVSEDGTFDPTGTTS